MKVALWDWRSEPVPDARLVVAWPGLWDEGTAAAYNAHLRRPRRDAVFVCAGRWKPGDSPHRLMIPALHVERQADLDGRVCSRCAGSGRVDDRGSPDVGQPAFDFKSCPAGCAGSGRIGGLRALLSAQAERRALVVSPREALNLHRALCKNARLGHPEHVWDDGCEPYDPAFINLLAIAGFDEPIYPEHVRSLVAQGRAAGLPVVFAGWGSWVTFDQLSEEAQDRADLGGETRGSGKVEEPFWYRVGAARSGALLDGETICDWPEWLRGDA